MLYSQNGDRIVTIDFVTSFHPVYFSALLCSRLLLRSQLMKFGSVSFQLCASVASLGVGSPHPLSAITYSEYWITGRLMRGRFTHVLF